MRFRRPAVGQVLRRGRWGRIEETAVVLVKAVFAAVFLLKH